MVCLLKCATTGAKFIDIWRGDARVHGVIRLRHKTPTNIDTNQITVLALCVCVRCWSVDFSAFPLCVCVCAPLFACAERPDTPSHLEIVEVSSRSVTLSWRRPFDGNSPVLSYIVQYQPMQRAAAAAGGTRSTYAHRLHPSSSSSATSATAAATDVATTGTAGGDAADDWHSQTTVNLTLPTISGARTAEGSPREQATLAGLHPSTTYAVRMLAVNEIEHSSYTEPVIIKTREEAPGEAPMAVQVLSGTSTGELIVTWQVSVGVLWVVIIMIL